MRQPMIAGNWKMNPADAAKALALVRSFSDRAAAVSRVETVVCPPYVFLHHVREALAGTRIALGAQNAFWEDKGAFTGEVSALQLAAIVDYVIVGHSERRQTFGDTDATVNRRAAAAIAHGLKPIMCVGETLEERQRGETEGVLVRQMRAGVAGLAVRESFVVAYEPVWAIGTGLAADGPTAQQAVALIRATLRESAGAVADIVRILYGGSVTPQNAAEFMAQPDVDGALVGGASLKADSFAAIIEATATAAR